MSNSGDKWTEEIIENGELVEQRACWQMATQDTKWDQVCENTSEGDQNQ